MVSRKAHTDEKTEADADHDTGFSGLCIYMSRGAFLTTTANYGFHVL